MPGSIFSRRSEGCHALIRDGAALVRTPDDILDEMGLNPRGTATRVDLSPDLPDDQERLLATLRDHPRTIDELAALTGLASPCSPPRLQSLRLPV